MIRNLIISFLGAFLAMSAVWADDEKLVARWLQKSSAVTTLQTSFVQSRNLTGLTVPLRQRGRLWIDHKHARMRWQVGDPPTTLVIRDEKGVLIVEPAVKRFERRKKGDRSGGVLISTLAKGLPHSVADFKRRYRLRDVVRGDKSYRIKTTPIGDGEKVVGSLVFVLSDEFRLQAVEIILRDRSRQSIRFEDTVINDPLPAAAFEVDLKGYKETKF